MHFPRWSAITLIIPAILLPPILAYFFSIKPPHPSSILAAPAELPLTVGFAETDITPTIGAKPVYLAGFGPNRKATGVHDPLFARAVVVSDSKNKVALVSIDVIGFFYPNVLNVRKGLPDFHQVIVSSTHSHEGPDTMGLWGQTPVQSGVDAEYVKKVEKQIIAAVQAADKNRKAARALIGSVFAPELLHDGRLPIVKHDELVTLEFRERESDRPIGVVMQWNCHPETLGSKNTLVSADFVGYAVSHVSAKKGCPVVYLSGTVGGMMTSLRLKIKGLDGQDLKEESYEKTERYGHLLGEAAERALAAGEPVKLTPIQAERRLIYLPITNPYYQLARTVGIVKRDAFVWHGDPDRAEPVGPKDGAKPLCLQTEIGYLQWGDLEIVAMPGEIYPELVLDKVQDPPDAGADFPDAPIEPGIYKQLLGTRRMIIGLANDEIGYIIPKRQWDQKPPYCYGRTEPQYGEVNSLGPDTAPLVCEAFRKLVKNER